jgi:hypothetical protein
MAEDLRFISNRAANLKTVAAGHQEIANDDLRSMLTGESQPGFAVIGLQDVPPVLGQQ